MTSTDIQNPTAWSDYDFLEFEAFVSKVENEGFTYAAEEYPPRFESPELQAIAADMGTLRTLYVENEDKVDAWYEKVGGERACDLHNAHVDEERKWREDARLFGIRCTDGHVITASSQAGRDQTAAYLLENKDKGWRVPAALLRRDVPGGEWTETDTVEATPTAEELLVDLGELHTRTCVSPLPKHPAAMGWQATAGSMAAGFARALHALNEIAPDKAAEIAVWFQGPFEKGPDPEEHTDWLERNVAKSPAVLKQWADKGRRMAEEANTEALEGKQTDLPTIVAICGSTRFMDQMTDADLRETAAGSIVVKPGCNMKQPHPLWADPVEAEHLKGRLDQLHRAKIRLADEVLVVGDYVGSSTTSEIRYARALGKPVRFTHPEVDPERGA